MYPAAKGWPQVERFGRAKGDPPGSVAPRGWDQKTMKQEKGGMVLYAWT